MGSFKNIFFLAFGFSLLTVMSCRKNLDETLVVVNNDYTPVQATLSGRVVTGSDSPLPNATISSGSLTRSTDVNGFYQFSEVLCNSNGQGLLIEKENFAPFLVNIKPESGGLYFSDVRLTPMDIEYSFMSHDGAKLFNSSYASLNIQANSIQDAFGRDYDGSVVVKAKLFDADQQDLFLEGAFEGRNEADEQVSLLPFVSVYFQLRSTSKAQLLLAAPAIFDVSSPELNDLSLYHYDEQLQYWQFVSTIEAGSAIELEKDGFYTLAHEENKSEAKIEVLSLGRPVANIQSSLVIGQHRFEAWTDQSGRTLLDYPDIGSCHIELYDACGNFLHREPLSEGKTEYKIDLGHQENLLHLKGKTVDCQQTTLPESYLTINQTTWLVSGADGQFEYNTINCSDGEIKITAYNDATNRKSSELSFTKGQQSIQLPRLMICDIHNGQYLRYQIDGSDYTIDHAVMGYSSTGDTILIIGDDHDIQHPYRPWDFMLTVDNSTPGDHIILSSYIYCKSDYRYYELECNSTCKINIDVDSNVPRIGDFLVGTFNGKMYDNRTGGFLDFNGEFKLLRVF